MDVLHSSQYSASLNTRSAGERFTLGLWVGSVNHLIAHCKIVQGALPQWTGFFDAAAQQAMPVHFVTTSMTTVSAVSLMRSQPAPASVARATSASSAIKVFFTAPGLSRLTALPGHSLPILLRREGRIMTLLHPPISARV